MAVSDVPNLDHFCRAPCDDSLRRYVTGNNGAGGDDCIITNIDAAGHNNAGSKPHVVTDRDICAALSALFELRRSEIVVCCKQHRPGPTAETITDPDDCRSWLPAREVIHVTPRTEEQILWIGELRRWFDPGPLANASQFLTRNGVESIEELKCPEQPFPKRQRKSQLQNQTDFCHRSRGYQKHDDQHSRSDAGALEAIVWLRAPGWLDSIDSRFCNSCDVASIDCSAVPADLAEMREKLTRLLMVANICRKFSGTTEVLLKISTNTQPPLRIAGMLEDLQLLNRRRSTGRL